MINKVSAVNLKGGSTNKLNQIVLDLNKVVPGTKDLKAAPQDAFVKGCKK